MTASRKTIRTIPQERTQMGAQDPQARVRNFLEVALGYTLEEALNEAERCLDCTDPTCIPACPVAIDIPAFIRRVADGDARGAYDIVAEANSLPAICGRVCPQEEQCEQVCTVADTLEPVAIGRLERWVGDLAIEHGWSAAAPPSRSERPRGRVGIVGSGPAGMACAADLGRAGCEVVVYEALHAPGGVLRYGIPEFRLPNRVIDAEIAKLRAMGVRFECNTLVGRLFTLDQMLTDMGFDAVFVATGAGSPRFMGIPGESLNGVISANELLTRTNLLEAADPGHDTPLGLGRRVAVVGAGNTAMDALRVSKRLGAEKVVCVYRRTRDEAPARAEELHHAEEEGIEFNWLTSPVEILDDGNGAVRAVRCGRMELGEPDESGRRRPVPIPGSEVTFDVDTLVYAIGTNANPIIGSTNPVQLNKWGYIDADSSLATSMAGVYAGGDIVTGAATVILAMGAGRRAARSIKAQLGILDSDVVMDPTADDADGPFGIAFGQHDGPMLRSAGSGRASAAGLRPAGLGRFIDPVALRTDYPLLLDASTGDVVPLSVRINRTLRDATEPGAPGDPVRRAVLEVERAMRRLADDEGTIPLHEAWERATATAPRTHSETEAPAVQKGVGLVRSALGDRALLVGCGPHTGPEVLTHLWQRHAEEAGRRWRDRLRPLTKRLSELLVVDRLADSDGSVRQLDSTLAGSFAADIDVNHLAGLVAGQAHHPSLDPTRRKRIAEALDVLDGDPRARLRPATGTNDAGSDAGSSVEAGDRTHPDRPTPALCFGSATDALGALRERMITHSRLVFAVRAAQLESSHRSDGDRYRHLTGRLEAGLFTEDELALLAPVLVTVHERDLDAAEQEAVLALLSSRARITILVTCADVVDADPLGSGPDPASPAVRLAHAARGLGSAAVAQVPVARLGRMVRDIGRCLDAPGPTLIVLHDGSEGPGPDDLHAYLASAAAAECRLFPAVVSIPGAGGAASDPPGSITVSATPQSDTDWATHEVELAGPDLQRATVEIPFRPSDVLAGDRRFSAAVDPPRAPEAEDLRGESDPRGRRLVDGDTREVVVAHVGEILEEIDAGVLRRWRALRRDGGLFASDPHHAGGSGTDTDDGEDTDAGDTPAAPQDVSGPSSPPPDDEPWVNTPRCSSCGECVDRFPLAFAYDRDNKAYLKDASAIGYADLVSVAEACQVAVIRPGLPPNPDDPALADLVGRAAPFNP